MLNDSATAHVLIVYHDYPIRSHPFALQAALWADAAALVGDFGAVQGALYRNQDLWSAGDIAKVVKGAVAPSDFKRIAQLVAGCHTAEFIEHKSIFPAHFDPHCRLQSTISADRRAAAALLMHGTPTIEETCEGQPGAIVVGYRSLKEMRDLMNACTRAVNHK